MFDPNNNHKKFQNHTKDFQKPNNQQHQENSIINQNSANITLKVIGVGGAGNNAIQMMDRDKFQNVEFIVANTDAQALFKSSCKNQIPLGKDTKGLGAGSDPLVGEKSAKESMREIEEKIKDADVVIIAAGFGGGTGTGAAPVIAEAAKNAGALTIAIVTTPFFTEGRKRTRVANEGIESLKTKVDSYIVVSNEKLMEHYEDVPVDDAFMYSNIYLKNIIVAIHDVLYRIGKVNIDYADVRKVLDNAGLTLVGLGQASGKDRAIKAVEKAFQNHLYSAKIAGAEKFLINIQYDRSCTLKEIRQAVNRVNEILNKDPEMEDDIIIGQETLDTKEDIFKVSIIAGRVLEKKDEPEIKVQPQPVVQQGVATASVVEQKTVSQDDQKLDLVDEVDLNQIVVPEYDDVVKNTLKDVQTTQEVNNYLELDEGTDKEDEEEEFNA